MFKKRSHKNSPKTYVGKMSFAEFVHKFISVLEKGNIDYVIVGGIAAIYYGEPRATQDLDVILKIYPDEKERIEYFVKLLKQNGFVIVGGVNMIIESLKEKAHFTIFNEEFVFRVDAQGIYSYLNKLAFEGRRRVTIFGVDAWIQGPEDLIIAKLTEYISNRDIKDVIAILKNSHKLINWDRLKRIAKEFKVIDKLVELLRELELIEYIHMLRTNG